MQIQGSNFLHDLLSACMYVNSLRLSGSLPYRSQDLLTDDSLLRELFVFFWPILGNARGYILTFFVMFTFIFSKLCSLITRRSLINILLLRLDFINPLNPRAFAKNAFFGHFNGFQAGSRPN